MPMVFCQHTAGVLNLIHNTVGLVILSCRALLWVIRDMYGLYPLHASAISPGQNSDQIKLRNTDLQTRMFRNPRH